MSGWHAWALVAVAASACSSSADDNGSVDRGDAAAMDGAGDAHPATSFGSIVVQLIEAKDDRPARGLATGKVYDGPLPEPTPLIESRREGDCALFVPRVAFCAPACPAGTYCADGATCRPFPRSQDVGPLTIQGLAEPVVMAPIPPSFAYESQVLPAPPCNEGDDVQLSGAGLSAQTRCVSPLVVTTAVPIAVRRNVPVRIEWTPPGAPGISTVRIRLDVAHHGGAKTGEIACTVADDGVHDIPASLVNELIDLGLAGFPSIILTRHATTPVGNQAGLSFAVSSTVERPVDTGVVSCLEDEACPNGQTCDRRLLVCRTP